MGKGIRLNILGVWMIGDGEMGKGEKFEFSLFLF